MALCSDRRDKSSWQGRLLQVWGIADNLIDKTFIVRPALSAGFPGERSERRPLAPLPRLFAHRSIAPWGPAPKGHQQKYASQHQDPTHY